MTWTGFRSRSRFLVAGLLLALPVLAGACAEGANLPVGPQTYTESAAPGHVGAVVTLEYSSFEPSVVTIEQGETVEWVWDDAPIPHDVFIQDYVTAEGTKTTVHSPIQTTGTWYQVFDQPGTYHYICTIHEGMAGVIIVKPSASGTTG